MTRVGVRGPVWANGTVPEGSMLGRLVGGILKPLSVAEVAGLLSAPAASTIGNLLTANQASGTDSLGATTGFGVLGGHQIASSAASPIRGTRSLTCTFAGTGAGGVVVGGGAAATSPATLPVVGGGSYTATAAVKSSAPGEVFTLSIYWFLSNGTTAASTASSTSGNFTSAGSASAFSYTAIAPSDAVLASVYLRRVSGADGTVFTVDDLGFWAGAGGMWAMPGVPIANTGRRVTHPNTDDVLVEVWDATQGRWQVAHYDSGWRNIASLLTTDATTKVQTWDSVLLRRVGSRVTLLVRATVGTGTAVGTSDSISLLTVPVGWRFTDYPCPGYLSHISAVGYPCLVDGGSGSGLVQVRRPIGTASGQWSNGLLDGEVSWATSNAIPTSLPGTLVSSAPYA